MAIGASRPFDKTTDESWRTKPGTRAVVVNDQGQVLLLLRPDTEVLYGGYWNLPGGAKEPGESFREGALRELAEETGLTGTPTGASAPFTFPGGRGVAHLVRHPEGPLHPDRREVAEARWFFPDELPNKLMPPTAEIVAALAGRNARGLMDELDVTPERVAVERWAASRFEPWLKAFVLAIAADKGIALPDGLQKGRLGNPRGFRDLDDEEMRRVTNVTFPPLDDGIASYRGTDAEGEELSARVLERARKLGASEAARAILSDAKQGLIPHGRSRGYRDSTIERLKSLARKNVRLIRATTEKKLALLAADAEAADVATLLAKLYSTVRAEAIGINTVAGGYVRGVLQVLHAHGYRYVYVRTMGDDRVCRQCAPREGQRMTILQFLAAYPLHPRCRCYPHPSPLAPVEDLRYMPKQTAKIVHEPLAKALWLGEPRMPRRPVPHVAATRSDVMALRAAAGDVTAREARAILGALDIAKAIAADAPEPKAKRKPATMPEPDARPRPFPLPPAIDLSNPDHLVAAGLHVAAHLRELPVGSDARKHLHRQYEVLRAHADAWHAKRGHGDLEPPELPDAPAFVPGGGRHLRTAPQFELAIARVTTREEAADLAHYFDAYVRREKKIGPAWDAVWHDLKAAMRQLPIAQED